MNIHTVEGGAALLNSINVWVAANNAQKEKEFYADKPRSRSGARDASATGGPEARPTRGSAAHATTLALSLPQGGLGDLSDDDTSTSGAAQQQAAGAGGRR